MIVRPGRGWIRRLEPRRALQHLACAAALLLLPAGAHAYCYGAPPPVIPGNVDGNVCGNVSRIRSFGLQEAPAFVKICPAGSTSGCTTVTTTEYTDPAGYKHDAFLFYRFRYGATGYQNFDVYAWGSGVLDDWGSSSKPIRLITVNGNGWEGLNLNMPPRPLNPTAIYPSGMSVPDHYTVSWQSGINVDRMAYPVHYEVWFKYWPFGGTEPAAWSLSTATLPCHADGSGPDQYGECSTYVAGPQPAGNWKWYVVADLDVSSVVYYPNTIFATKSGAKSFLQPE